MKKTYINPEMEIISVDAQDTILTGSSIPMNLSETKAPSAAEGRGYDDWEDEEDEEW